MGIVRIVRMEFKGELVSEFDTIFADSKSKIEDQPGCQQVLMLRSTANSGQRTTMSWWDDEHALNAYRHSELFGKVWPKTKALFSEDPIAWSMDWAAEIAWPS